MHVHVFGLWAETTLIKIIMTQEEHANLLYIAGDILGYIAGGVAVFPKQRVFLLII